MDYNYHTHTKRCSHATGTEEEYILRAISGGIKYMGFSDHAPYVCINGEESGYRVPMSEAGQYVADIAALRDKYKGQIDISIGFEMEYYESEFERMLETVRGFGAEYLILGQHFFEDESSGAAHTSYASDSIEHLKHYVHLVTKAMKTGAFTYVAHPDIVGFTGDEDVYLEEMKKICIASRELNVPLEINFLGIRDGRIYPREIFWRLAGEVGSPVTFGFDAHDVGSAYDASSLVRATELVEKYSLNYIGKPELRPL